MKFLAIVMMLAFSFVGVGLMASTSSHSYPFLKCITTFFARLSSVIGICAIIVMSAEPARLCGWGIVNACLVGVLMRIVWFMG
jgi:hypothetical protein